jgi:hypothetical protein
MQRTTDYGQRTLAKILLCLDTDPQPSVFDAVVAVDAAAEQLLRHGGVTPDAVRNLVYGAMFTRAPGDLKNTAIFIGGSDVAAGEALLAKVRECFFGPMRVSVMLDSNGSNTTAVAAVAKLLRAAGDVKGRRAVIFAGTGPVGVRAAGLLAKAGAVVTMTSRRGANPGLIESLKQRFGGTIETAVVADAAQAAKVLDGAVVALSAGPPGVQLVPRSAWANRPGLVAVADLNAVPPLGIEGIEVTDNAVDRDGVKAFGALGVGGLKMKIHKACIARLFERNDLVLDAETIVEVAESLVARA